MTYSRKQITQSIILFKDKKAINGYFSTGKITIEPNIKMKETMATIEEKLLKALGTGLAVEITYFDGVSFQKISGFVQGFQQTDRKVNIVYFNQQWSIRVCDIVRIEEE